MNITYKGAKINELHPIEFELLEFDIHCGMVKEDGSFRNRIKTYLKLNMGGTVIEGESVSGRKESACTGLFQEPDGPYDILHHLLQSLIIQRWSRMREFLEEQVTVNNVIMHEVHVEGEKKSYVSAAWKCCVGVGTNRTIEFSAGCESQNSIRAMTMALVAAYHLIVQRWLIMEKGKERAAARLMNGKEK